MSAMPPDSPTRSLDLFYCGAEADTAWSGGNRVARARLRGLRVVTMAPDDAIALLRAGDHALIAQVRDASLCVLGPGTGTPLATALLLIRGAGGPGATWSAAAGHVEVARGLVLGGVRDDGPWVPTLTPASRIPEQLLAHFAPAAAIQIEVLAGERPPLRPPFRVAAWGTTGLERSPSLTDHGRLSLCAMAALFPPAEILAMARPAATAMPEATGPRAAYHILLCRAMFNLVQWQPSAGLDALASRGATAAWMHLLQVAEANANLSDLFFAAMARDGGRRTLAGWPAAGAGVRADLEAQWERAVGGIRAVVEDALRNPRSRLVLGNRAAQLVLDHSIRFGALALEDPFDAAADPTNYQPTVTTLDLAARYRSAPQVIELAIARWGIPRMTSLGHEDHLQIFLGRHPPADAAELREWETMLADAGPRLRKVALAAMQNWPLLPPSLAGYVPPKHAAGKIPCLLPDGAPNQAVMDSLPPAHAEAIRRFWREGQRMPPAPIPTPNAIEEFGARSRSLR